MARIRSVKPALRTSVLVASWPFEMRYFFVLLWGYLDDKGRGLDVPKQIAGDCFPHDEKITAGKVDAWLKRMQRGLGDNPGPICRYEIGGVRYLHCVNWSEHQRPNRPTASRIPPCPTHEPPQRKRSEPLTEPSSESHSESAPPESTGSGPVGAHNGGHESVTGGKQRSAQSPAVRNGSAPPGTNLQVPAPPLTESLTQTAVTGEGEKRRRGGEERSLRSRTARASRAEPPPSAAGEPGTAERILAAWIAGCRKPPPSRTVNDVGRQVAALLHDGVDPDDIAEGVRLWQARGLHPSVLPSVVNQVMNQAPPPPSNVVALRSAADPRPSTTDQRVSDALALAAELHAEEADRDAG